MAQGHGCVVGIGDEVLVRHGISPIGVSDRGVRVEGGERRGFRIGAGDLGGMCGEPVWLTGGLYLWDDGTTGVNGIEVVDGGGKAMGGLSVDFLEGFALEYLRLRG